MTNILSPTEVVENYNLHIDQTLAKHFEKRNIKIKHNRPIWFDRECKQKRLEAISSAKKGKSQDNTTHINDKCKLYNSMKQRKKGCIKNHV